MSVMTTLAHCAAISGCQSRSWSSSEASSDIGTSGTLGCRRLRKCCRCLARLSVPCGTERSRMCSVSSDEDDNDEEEEEEENMGEEGMAD